MKKETLGVALTKEACRICGEEFNGPIVMNKVLTEHTANQVKELQGQCIGYMEKPCKDCQELMAHGFVLIGVIKALTEELDNPYRSGNLWVVTHEYAERLFKDDPDALNGGVAFIDIKEAEALGFPIQQTSKN